MSIERNSVRCESGKKVYKRLSWKEILCGGPQPPGPRSPDRALVARWQCLVVQLNKSGVVEVIQMWLRAKQQVQLNQKCSATKRSKLKDLPKLDDANDAGQ